MESSSCQMFPRGADPGQVERRVLSMQGVHDVRTYGGVSLVCPARPVSGSGEQCGASEALGRSHTQESAEASSERCVMVRCEKGSELRVDDSTCVVGSSTATVQEQQPSALKILDGKDLLHQLIVRLRQTRQLRTDELGVAQRSAQNPHALLLFVQCGIASPNDGVRVVDSGHCLQHLDANWNDPTTIPHLCLSVVDPNRRMGKKCILQERSPELGNTRRRHHPRRRKGAPRLQAGSAPHRVLGAGRGKKEQA